MLSSSSPLASARRKVTIAASPTLLRPATAGTTSQSPRTMSGITPIITSNLPITTAASSPTSASSVSNLPRVSSRSPRVPSSSGGGGGFNSDRTNSYSSRKKSTASNRSNNSNNSNTNNNMDNLFNSANVGGPLVIEDERAAVIGVGRYGLWGELPNLTPSEVMQLLERNRVLEHKVQSLEECLERADDEVSFLQTARSQEAAAAGLYKSEVKRLKAELNRLTSYHKSSKSKEEGSDGDFSNEHSIALAHAAAMHLSSLLCDSHLQDLRRRADGTADTADDMTAILNEISSLQNRQLPPPHVNRSMQTEVLADEAAENLRRLYLKVPPQLRLFIHEPQVWHAPNDDVTEESILQTILSIYLSRLSMEGIFPRPPLPQLVFDHFLKLSTSKTHADMLTMEFVQTVEMWASQNMSIRNFARFLGILDPLPQCTFDHIMRILEKIATKKLKISLLLSVGEATNLAREGNFCVITPTKRAMACVTFFWGEGAKIIQRITENCIMGKEGSRTNLDCLISILISLWEERKFEKRREIDAAFHAADTRGIGHLNFIEFQTAAHDMAPSSPDASLTRAFSSAIVDGREEGMKREQWEEAILSLIGFDLLIRN